MSKGIDYADFPWPRASLSKFCNRISGLRTSVLQSTDTEKNSERVGTFFILHMKSLQHLAFFAIALVLLAALGEVVSFGCRDVDRWSLVCRFLHSLHHALHRQHS